MNIYTNTNSSFPSQVVSDAEKASLEYGIQVARAIEQEWFDQGRTNANRYQTNYNNFHQLRLYARGEQSIQKYKDELAINGDLSYLNLDWKPVPVISKFVDIVVNGMTQKGYQVKAMATDPFALKQRTNYAFNALRDIENKAYLDQINAEFGQNLYSSSEPDKLPDNKEELDLFIQLSYKQSVEIAEEEVIKTVLSQNKYDETKKKTGV